MAGEYPVSKDMVQVKQTTCSQPRIMEVNSYLCKVMIIHLQSYAYIHIIKCDAKPMEL